MKHIYTMIVLSGLLIFLVGCSGSNLQPVDEGSLTGEGKILRVGVCPNYPPIVFKEDGRITGLEADLARALSRELRRPLEFVELRWTALIPSLAAGRVDVIMSGMSITDDREELIRFLPPYLRIAQMALIREKDLGTLGEPSALYETTSRVGFESRTTGEEFVRRKMPRAEPVPLDDADDGYEALLSGRIDIFIHDAPTIWRVASEKSNQGLIGLFRPLTEEQLAWAVRKEDEALYDELSSLLSRWEESGYLQKLINRRLNVRIEVE